MLVGERHFVDINDPSCPADIAAISLFAQTGHGEPLLGAVQLGGSTGYHVREQLKGSISPTVLAWIERDSLAFKFVMPDNRKVAFWFDPDLRVEPTDSIISGDEMVYVVHPHERTSPFRVEGFRVSRGPTGMDFTLVDSGEGRFYWYNEGLEVTIRISRDQIGFQTVDSLALCGFGMESLWWEGDEPEGLMENSERLPKGFDRNKPSTWGNLVLGKREDHVNERELWRYLEQDGE